jgi:hypothetical protein
MQLTHMDSLAAPSVLVLSFTPIRMREKRMNYLIDAFHRPRVAKKSVKNF